MPGLAAARDDVAQEHARAEREHGANDLDRARHVERARYNVVHVRSRCGAKHAVDGGQQLDERERERCLRRRWLCREIGTGKVASPLFAATLEQVDDFTHLLILEQATNELRARILPLLLLPHGQQELRFYAKEPRRHLQVLSGIVERQRSYPCHELLRDAGDRDVVDVDLLLANQRQQEIERPGELGQLDGEGVRAIGDRRLVARGHCSHREADGSTEGLTASSSLPLTTFAGCSQ